MSKGKSQNDIVDYDAPGCDYIKYWRGRQYEHQAEKMALKKLLPVKGESIVDLGGGYGRLTPLYARIFEEVTIVDISEKHLKQAQVMIESLGLQRVEVKKGDVYNLPLKTESIEVAMMIRVLHHLKSLKRVFAEVHRILQPDGLFILEFPNKCHFKAVVRNLVRGNWRFCFDQEPFEQLAAGREGIFYNYHPRYVKDLLRETGFQIEKSVSVSNLRSPLLKRAVPLKTMVFLERILQIVFSPLKFGPSIFLRCRKVG